MFTVIGCMIAGIFIGYAARRIRFSWISLLITGLIWILLFLLGWEVGHNKGVISALPTLGLDALLLTLAALLGSSLAAWGLWKVVCVTYKGKDTIQKDREFACKGGNIACEEKNITNEKGGTAYKKGGATSEEISAASEGESTIRKEEKEEKR
jgi:hypothetical protein